MADAGAGSGRLTTHVLDTARGMPAEGLGISLFRLAEGRRILLAEVTTNADGRCDRPLIEGADFTHGIYEIVFNVGDYLADSGGEYPEPMFLDEVPVRFGVAEARHYHVPLLLSPFGYSTYRGS